MDYIFYFPEWTVIIDTLIKEIPEKDPFNLYELSKGKKIVHGNEFSDWLFDTKETYDNLTKALLLNHIFTPVGDNLVKLTEEGMLLKFEGSWRKYQDRLYLQKRASYWKTWRDANWLPITIIGFIITTFVSVTISILVDQKEKPTNNTIRLKIDLVPPLDSISPSLSIDTSLVLTPGE